MNEFDLKANIEMYFLQIRDLTDLMIENQMYSTPNLITIRDLTQSGLDKLTSKETVFKSAKLLM